MSVEDLLIDSEKQLALNLQLDKMTKAAFGDKILAPKKLTHESQEAVKEYNKQFKIVEYEKDENGEPVLDALGKPIKKKKTIIAPPELDAIPELTPVDFSGRYFGFPELGDLEGEAGLEVLLNQIEAEKEQLAILQKDKQHVLDLINETGTSSKNGQEKVKRLMSYIPKIEKKIKEVSKKLDQIAANNNNYLYLNEIMGQVRAEDAATIQGIKNLNEKKIQSYKETLKALNTGGMNTEKISGETEEDYLERLRLNAEMDTPDQVEFEAIEYTRTKFKENMKELFRNESLIESVANQLKQTDTELEDKIMVNKKFPVFKREFIDTFGKNNKEITASDVIEFIQSFISGDTKIIKELKKIVKGEEEEEKPIALEEEEYFEIEPKKLLKAPKESIYTIKGPKAKIHFMPIIDDNYEEGEGTGFFQLLWSPKLTRHSFVQLIDNDSFKEIKQFSGLNKGEIIAKINGKSPSFMAKTLIEKMGIKPVSYQDFTQPFKMYDENYGEEIYGWGIEPEKIPEVVPFGKLQLHLHKLYYKNSLVIKHKDGSNIIGFPNTPVSDDFVKIIMKLLKEGDIKQKDLNTLKTIELHLYNRLIMLADLHKKHPIESDKTIEHLKHKLELLTGEIVAGNDNKDLVKQLHQVVHSLKNFGAITSTAATAFIKQYK